MADRIDLRRAASEIFTEALSSMDAAEAVRGAVGLDGTRLKIVDTGFDLRARPLTIYSIAIGKAAAPMAAALDGILGDRLAGGILSAPPTAASFSDRWRLFRGGHPVPNEASLAAARAAFELLRLADNLSALVIFLVSGGGSAMIEWPRDERITLGELSEANRVLVSCGASIAEINAVRRAISAVKGGGLGARAPRAAQVTLIISDVAPGEESNVASGPTLLPPPDTPDAAAVIARYDLGSRLPAAVLRATERPFAQKTETASQGLLRRHYVLLDNGRALERAAEAARERGFTVELARDLAEQPVAEGSAALVSRLFDLRRRARGEGSVCLISGGEFACPVRGPGVGGRNAETALRCALEMDVGRETPGEMVALSAGTDGIDGNSPAAGALADSTTLSRARAKGLDARKFLDASDAYTFFAALGDTVMTGPTGTNVRDLRVLLAR